MRTIINAIVAMLVFMMLAGPAFAQHYHHGYHHGYHHDMDWHSWRGDRIGPSWDMRFQHNRNCWQQFPPLIGPWVRVC